ncbi:MAG: UDP-N-acetylmuramoyl-L-alanine--D-glutamate ligase [bacterium]|nr:UDP-N-acetylmuramoyl-L-alanine--D-glutamate ligase [bacterium]MDY3861690.1 UDP-N-acetylmuramoyl-L-alanine--D-glutamate ligase [Ruminococcus sp.]
MNEKVKMFFDSLKGKKVTFCGIGTSNLPLIELFAKNSADVYACDKKSYEQLGENAKIAEKAGAKLILGDDYLKNLDTDILFRSPGTPFYKEELEEMKSRGVVVTSEMEVFFDLCPCKIIAVTGSDGKTTTTTIISEMLKAAGFNVHLGGNIGKPLLPEIESISPEDFAVVELSSFQLISMRKSPDIAVVTNLAPNHLDIHKDMQEYVDAKKNIILHQNAFSKAVLNLDNDIANSFDKDVRGQVSKFSRRNTVKNGAYLNGTTIVYSDYGRETSVMDIKDIKIPGMHNVENYLAAVTALWGIVTPEIMKKVAQEFSGVAHRAEFVREFDGVKYYNDSIASSPTRTALGTLSLYDEKIIIIAGGYDKHIPYEPLGPVICKKVKTLILLGDTAEKIKKAVTECGEYSENNPKIIMVNNMEEAVNEARENAVKGDIVSLSPASASFGLYKNFEERGNHFKDLVNSL